MDVVFEKLWECIEYKRINDELAKEAYGGDMNADLVEVIEEQGKKQPRLEMRNWEKGIEQINERGSFEEQSKSKALSSQANPVVKNSE